MFFVDQTRLSTVPTLDLFLSAMSNWNVISPLLVHGSSYFCRLSDYSRLDSSKKPRLSSVTVNPFMGKPLWELERYQRLFDHGALSVGPTAYPNAQISIHFNDTNSHSNCTRLCNFPTSSDKSKYLNELENQALMIHQSDHDTCTSGQPNENQLFGKRSMFEKQIHSYRRSPTSSKFRIRTRLAKNSNVVQPDEEDNFIVNDVLDSANDMLNAKLLDSNNNLSYNDIIQTDLDVLFDRFEHMEK